VISEDKLKESRVAFFFCGILIGCILLGLAKDNIVLKSIIFLVSFLGYSIYWWRTILFLDRKDQKAQKN
jgi:hypothetical protein